MRVPEELFCVTAETEEVSRAGDHPNSTVIITHDNGFHADDVLASYILLTLHKDSIVIRTRDQSIIDKGDYVIDVGGVYNHQNHRYDHHQREFNEVYNEKYNIKLSSAGLVYKHYGEEFLNKLFTRPLDKLQKEIVLSSVYERYIASVDANDNGIEVSDSPRYKDRTLDDIVRSFYPIYLKTNDYNELELERLKAFRKAMTFISEDITRFCHTLCYETDYNTVKIQAEYKLDQTNQRYMIFSVNAMFSLVIPYFNEKYNRNVSVIIYPRGTKQGTIYSILCLSKKNLKYNPEIPLCERWRGLRENQIDTTENTLLNDLIFVHSTGFCGAAKTVDCAIYMVEQSIKESLS
ncbi:hypothetical protein NEOKW01_2050 [Nematocida sp. AWRm80]|nr:hypothetical protein NEOKW01_2050 [Nematocida sp. AWRm80]